MRWHQGERAHEPRLERQRELADLVEEEGATARGAKCAVPGYRPSEGAGDVAKELGPEERLGERAAVDGDEFAAEPAHAVESTGDELLSGAGLAFDEDEIAAPRTAIDAIEQCSDRRGGPDDLIGVDGAHPARWHAQRRLRTRSWRAGSVGFLATIDPPHAPGAHP